MNKTRAVNRRIEQFDIYIGRGSKWGNPFPINEGTGQTREVVIARYTAYLLSTPELLEAIPELVGKRLGCYCSPKLCHGNLLSELAEEYRTYGRIIFE